MPANTISRRTVAKGAAWAAPALVVGSAAPAIAASCDPKRTCPVNISFGSYSGGTATTAWSGSVSGTTRWTENGKDPGFRNNDPLFNAVGPWFGVGQEAQTAVTLTATKTNPITLSAGCFYYASLDASVWQGQAETTVRMFIGNQEVLTFTPPTGDPTAKGSRASAIQTVRGVNFTVPTTGQYPVKLTISMVAVGATNGYNNNDVYVSNLQLRCA